MNIKMIDKIGPITQSLLTAVVEEVQRKETRDKIQHQVIDPILQDISSRFYPYFILVMIVMALIIFLLIAILITTSMKSSTNS